MDCEPNPDCKYFNSDIGCHTDTHHLWSPRSEYKTSVEKQFRRLACNVMEMCRVEHEELHAVQPHPEKPPRSYMLAEIQRYASS